MRNCSAALVFLCCLPLCSCSSAKASPEPVRSAQSIGFQVPDLGESSQYAAAARQLNEELVEAGGTGNIEKEFWSASFLAQLHAFAVDAPFLLEPGTTGTSPSSNAHLVASVENASLALEILPSLANESVPAGLTQWAPEGYARLRTTLEFTSAISYGRLGFPAALDTLLRAWPDCSDPSRVERQLDELALTPELRAPLCALLSRRARASAELDAFRFAILAIEGRLRFGAALSESSKRDLENWILHGASVRFVCPRSQTEYLPGRTASPVSGVPHMEYVAIARQ